MKSIGQRAAATFALGALLLPLVGATSGLFATASPLVPAPACSVSALTRAPQPGLTVTSATSVGDGHFAPPGGSMLDGLPVFCAVSAVRRDPVGNPLHIELWLPDRWNHRSQGVGGGGYSCGISWPALALALQAGYASASTDL